MSGQADIRAGGAAFLADYDERGMRLALLETENKAVHEQLDAVLDDNTRLRSRVEQLVARLDSLLHDHNADKELLDDLANKILIGLRRRRPEMRGSPVRNDDPLPKVVRMGPAV